MEPVCEPMERAFASGKAVPSFPALLGDPPFKACAWERLHMSCGCYSRT